MSYLHSKHQRNACQIETNVTQKKVAVFSKCKKKSIAIQFIRACQYQFEAWPCFENIELPAKKDTASVFKSSNTILPHCKFYFGSTFQPSEIGNFVTRFMVAGDVTKLSSWPLLLGMNNNF